MVAKHCEIKNFRIFRLIVFLFIKIYILFQYNYFSFKSMYSVYLGVQYMSEKKSGVVFNVSRVIAHPGYDKIRSLNDIALIKLDGRVELSERVQLACLPDPKQPGYPSKVDVSAYANGWGTLDNYGEMTPDVLQNVEITVFDSQACENVIPSMPKNWTNQICAGKPILLDSKS